MTSTCPLPNPLFSRRLTCNQNKKESKAFTEMLKAIDFFPKPIVSIVNGNAFGGALGIIAASDFALSVKESNFCFSEVKLGLVPAMIAPYVIRTIGYKASKKLFLTGEVFNSEKALNIGLIDDIVNLKDFNLNSSQLLKNLINSAPIAQNKIKSFLKKIYYKEIDNIVINQTTDTISKIRITREAQEGLSAFLEKRKPSWSKK